MLCLCVCVKQSEECGGVITQLEARQHFLSSGLREKQTDLSDLQNSSAVLTQDLTALQKNKERVSSQTPQCDFISHQYISKFNLSLLITKLSPQYLFAFRLQNLSRLLTLQSQAKHLQDVKQGRYRPVAGEDTVLELEKLKQEKRLKTVSKS